MTKTLLDKAYANLSVAGNLFPQIRDERQFDFVGYHIQQGVEDLIKFILEQNGCEYPKSHNIRQLIQLAESHDVDLLIPDYLEDHAEMLTEWEAMSRYDSEFSLDAKRAVQSYTEALTYFSHVAHIFTHETYPEFPKLSQEVLDIVFPPESDLNKNAVNNAKNRD